MLLINNHHYIFCRLFYSQVLAVDVSIYKRGPFSQIKVGAAYILT